MYGAEAQSFAKTVFAWPGLHRRVKVVGLAAFRHEHIRLDSYIKLPFTVNSLLNTIERVSAELVAGG